MRERDSCPVDGGISKDTKDMRNGPRWLASLPPRATEISVPGLLLGLMSGFMALMLPPSLLMPMASDTSKQRG